MDNNLRTILAYDKEESSSRLSRAARDGLTEEVIALAGSDSHLIDINDYRPLHGAADGGHTETVLALLKLGFPADLRNNKCSTALHRAANAGSVLCCKALVTIGGADIDAEDYIGYTPLGRASKSLDVISYLAASGANLNHKSIRGHTSLSRCAILAENESLKLLLSLGADPNLVVKGETALQVAVRKKNFTGALALVNHHATLDIKRRGGTYLIHEVIADIGGQELAVAMIEKG